MDFRYGIKYGWYSFNIIVHPPPPPPLPSKGGGVLPLSRNPWFLGLVLISEYRKEKKKVFT